MTSRKRNGHGNVERSKFSSFPVGTSIVLPGSVLPLEFEYKIREIGSSLQLSADLRGEIWEAPLGVKGLLLSEVSLATTLQTTALMRAFSFEVSAVFAYGDSVITLTGAYATGGGLVLSAVVEEFDLHSICDIYAAITGSDLVLPTIDATISRAILTISSSDGLTLVLHELRIDEYLIPEATLHIDHVGVFVNGLLSPTNIMFGDIELCSAYLELRLGAGDVGIRSSVALGGQISFGEFGLTVLVHLSRAGTNNALDWTLYGNLATQCPLSRLVPLTKDSPVGNLVLTNVAFVVSSRDDPDTAHDLFFIPYRVRKGIQVCAMLSPIPMLDSLLRRSSTSSMRGLVLSAAWSPSTGFEIDITFPGDAVLDLGHGIRTEPFSLSIRVDPRPRLVLTAGLRIPVALPVGQALLFQLSVSIDTIGADATAELHGYWANPLGLGEDVAIGPDVVLSIGVIYAEFMTTGTPSQFAVGGGLQIGSKAAHMLMQLSEDPSRQLLEGGVNELGAQDIVALASAIFRSSIPKLPEVVQFRDASLYVCPFWTTIGTKTYPQGFSFEGTMIVFNHTATVACEIADGNIRVKGEIDSFKLGPLSVRGVEKINPSVDVYIGPSEQRIFIDGSISVFEATTAVHIDVQIMPSPTLNCYMNLRFTERFAFAMEARLLGTLSFGSLYDADLEFSADMQQDILQYVRGEIDKKLSAFRETTAENVKQAQNALAEEKRKADAAIDTAQKNLDAAERSWQEKYQKTVKDAQTIIDNYLATLRRLESEVRDVQARYDTDLRNAERAVHEANVDRAAAMHKAETALENAKRDAKNSINSAPRELRRTKEEMRRRFGNAIRDIEAAKQKVAGINRDIDNIEAEIDRCNNLPWYDPERAAIIGYALELVALCTARDLAYAALDVAEAVVTGSEYIAAEAAIGAAEELLEIARATAETSIGAAEDVVRGADEASQEVLRGACDTLEGVRTTGLQALRLVQRALTDFTNANEAAFKAARHAIDTVESCAEHAAFGAAKEVLVAAKMALESLDMLKEALNAAIALADVATRVAQLVADSVLSLVDIREMHVSGTLRGLLGVGGKIAKPFHVHVEFTLLGRDYTFDGVLDLRDIAAHIADLFERIVDELSKIG